MNLGQAQQELGDRGFDYLSGARMIDMLNDAMTSFEDYYPWPWLKTTVTGAAPLIITDLKYVRSVYDSAQNEMFGMDDDDDVYISQAGTPQNWWVDDTGASPTLRVWPVGTATLTVSYYATDAALASPTDTPRMPARYHRRWVDLAVIEAYKDSDNFAAASQLQAVVDTKINRMISVFETRNRMNSQYIRILAGSEDE